MRSVKPIRSTSCSARRPSRSRLSIARQASCLAPPRNMSAWRSKVENPELRAEALLLAGQLYQEATDEDRALAAYLRYVEQFPKPVEAAAETRFKIAAIYQSRNDLAQYPRAVGADRSHRCRLRC